MTSPQPSTSNFGFVGRVWPALLIECRQAEAAAVTNPRGSAFQSRRILEQVVRHIGEWKRLGTDPSADLNTRMNAPAFKQTVPAAVLDKMHVIRKRGNDAVHGQEHFPAQASVRVLQHLFDVLVWATANTSVHRDIVRTLPAFNVAILQQAPKQSASSQPQIKKLAKELAEKDRLLAEERKGTEATDLLLSEAEAKLLHQESQHAKEKARFEQRQAEIAEEQARTEEDHARALAEKDRVAAELQAELNRLREQQRDRLAESTSTAPVDTSGSFAISEADTRRDLIDPMLEASGFSEATGTLSSEYKVTGLPATAAPSGVGFVDYVLWGEGGEPLAVLEAKRAGASISAGQQQAKLYADAVARETGTRPVILYTTGHRVFLWDDAANLPEGGPGYPPREVEGYPTARELKRMILRRGTRTAISQHAVDEQIAGRAYQVETIRSVAERFTAGHHRALVVMATGTGKTRTAIALTKLLQQAGWVGKTLFLADRTELVKQARNAFTSHLPETTVVNLLEDKKATGQVYLSTYQTMIDLINDDSPEGARFTPFDFDLVIVDEAHRTIYRRYRRIFDYFDSFLIGLTATPRDEVDHDTYAMFDQNDGNPTAVYTLEQAIREEHLVPFRVFQAESLFLRRGIHYEDLSPEDQATWDAAEWGSEESGEQIAPPDEISPAEINQRLYNRNTIDKVLRTLMENGIKVSGADHLGKTIIFARNQRHADLIFEQWSRAFPSGGGDDAAVITHQVKDPGGLIEKFKDPKSGLNVAISVDMMDTGVDVPEVVNLVYFKPVYSPTKFWQMIGRGTRLSPDLFAPGVDKKEFFVFDFCDNFAQFSGGGGVQITPGSRQVSLSERLFMRRVSLLNRLESATTESDSVLEKELQESLRTVLRDQVDGVPLNSILVRPADREVIERFREPAAWQSLDTADLSEIENHLAHLPFATAGEEEQAKRFDLLILGMQLALAGAPEPNTWEKDQSRVMRLAENLSGKMNVAVISQAAGTLEKVTDQGWWEGISLPELEVLRRELRGLIRFVDRRRTATVITDLEDEMGDLVEIPVDYRSANVSLDMEQVERQLRASLQKFSGEIAMQKLRTARPLSPLDIDSLEAMVADTGVEGVEELRERLGGDSVPAFIRRLVGLDEVAVKIEFQDFLEGSTLNSQQIAFMRTLVRVLSTNGSLTVTELFEPPFDDNGSLIEVFEDQPAVIVDIRQRLEKINGSALAGEDLAVSAEVDAGF